RPARGPPAHALRAVLAAERQAARAAHRLPPSAARRQVRHRPPRRVGRLEQLIDRYIVAARLALEAGYQFVDVKACHGYLLHEFLSARTRPGKFGGDLAGRSRLLVSIVRRIREAYADLHVMVRVSIFDFVPYKTSRETGE